MNLSRVFVVICSLTLAACATNRPEKIPQIDCAQSEALTLHKVTKRTLEISVTNHKKINQTAGNSVLVADQVKAAFACAAEKGGFKITRSPNKLHLDIVDCEAPSRDENVDMTCINIKNDLKTPNFEYSGESAVSNGYTLGSSHFVHPGEVDPSYLKAVQQLIHLSNTKLK